MKNLGADLSLQPKLAKVFNLVFFSTNTYAMRQNLGAHSSNESITIDKNDFPQLLQTLAHHPTIQMMLPHLWETVERNEQIALGESQDGRAQLKFALAMLLSNLPLEETPLGLQEKLGQIPRLNNYNILALDEEWDLCSYAEQNLTNATSEQVNGVIFVDKNLLVKVSHGIITALCINPVVTNEGILIPGIWYCPLNPVRGNLRELYDKGIVHYESGDTSVTWVLQRPMGIYQNFIPLDQSPAQVLNTYRVYTDNLPQQAAMNIYDVGTRRMVDRGEFRRIHEHDSDRSIISGL